MSSFDVKCQGEVSGQERVCSGGQCKLRFSLFLNPLTFLHVDKVKVSLVIRMLLFTNRFQRSCLL